VNQSYTASSTSKKMVSFSNKKTKKQVIKNWFNYLLI
jgi:hypothetical protein